MKSQKQLIAVVSAVVWVAARAADPVDCDEPSNWMSSSDMTAVMKSEGQRIYGSANVVRDKRFEGGVVFTTNEERSVGYILRTDKTLHERTENMCVAKRLTALRFFDATKRGVDARSLVSASKTEAERTCNALADSDAKRYARNTCGYLNDMIRLSEPSGDRIMAEGFNVEKQVDGSFKPNGWLTTISANMGDFSDKDPAAAVSSSILFSALPSGATFLNTILIEARYTPYGLSLLK